MVCTSIYYEVMGKIEVHMCSTHCNVVTHVKDNRQMLQGEYKGQSLAQTAAQYSQLLRQ